jgi:hypothetical protein
LIKRRPRCLHAIDSAPFQHPSGSGQCPRAPPPALRRRFDLHRSVGSLTQVRCASRARQPNRLPVASRVRRWSLRLPPPPPPSPPPSPSPPPPSPLPTPPQRQPPPSPARAVGRLQSVALLCERGAGVVRGVQARAPSAYASDAPRLAGVRRRLAFERPLTAPPEPLRRHAWNRRFRGLMRTDRGRCRRLRAERSGAIDSRSNAPGIALGRPRVAEKLPSGAHSAMSPRRPPRPCSCHRPSRRCSALYAQERASGGSGALGRVMGRPPGASAAARTSVLTDYVVPTRFLCRMACSRKVAGLGSILFNI